MNVLCHETIFLKKVGIILRHWQSNKLLKWSKSNDVSKKFRKSKRILKEIFLIKTNKYAFFRLTY